MWIARIRRRSFRRCPVKLIQARLEYRVQSWQEEFQAGSSSFLLQSISASILWSNPFAEYQIKHVFFFEQRNNCFTALNTRLAACQVFTAIVFQIVRQKSRHLQSCLAVKCG